MERIDKDSRSKGLLTGYAGSSPPGPMIYWLGRRGGTPWDRLGGALPVEKMTIITIYCWDIQCDSTELL